MEFKISSNKFKKVISLASRICNNSLTLPILNSILLEAKEGLLNVSSTNLEIGSLLSVPINLEKEGEGSVVVPGRIFSDFINSLPDEEIKIKEKDFSIEVVCGKFRAKFLGQNPNEFPIIPKVKEKEFISVDAEALISGFSMVNHIVSPSDSRVEISGILMTFKEDKLKIVGTDSVRLGEKTIKLFQKQKEKSVIIPQKTSVEFISGFSNLKGNVGIAIDSSQISFAFSSEKEDINSFRVVLVSRLIEGKYPAYEEIIPKKTPTTAILKKEELKKKIKTASFFSSRIQDVKLKFKPQKEQLLISASSSEVGEASLETKGDIKGEEIEAIFNWKYLLDGLSAINSSEVFLGLCDQTSPALIQPIGDKSYLYVLMPKTI